MEETKSGIGLWGVIILVFLFFIAFGGGWGNCGGFGFGRGGNCGGCGNSSGLFASLADYAAFAQNERQGLVTAAETNYRIIDQANATRMAIEASAATTNAKIDFYAYQGLRDKLAERDREVMELKNQLFVKDQLAPISAQLASIQCNMLVKPQLYGQAVSCPTSAVNYYSNSCCGCGTVA